MATVLTAVMVPVAAATAAGGGPARADVTSAVERRRVDGVATPQLRWKACRDLSPRAECATVKLPLDYDAPRGRPSTSLLAGQGP